MTSKSITTKTTKLDAGLVASITHPTCLEASEVLLLRRPPQQQVVQSALLTSVSVPVLDNTQLEHQLMVQGSRLSI